MCIINAVTIIFSISGFLQSQTVFTQDVTTTSSSSTTTITAATVPPNETTTVNGTNLSTTTTTVTPQQDIPTTTVENNDIVTTGSPETTQPVDIKYSTTQLLNETNTITTSTSTTTISTETTGNQNATIAPTNTVDNYDTTTSSPINETNSSYSSTSTNISTTDATSSNNTISFNVTTTAPPQDATTSTTTTATTDQLDVTSSNTSIDTGADETQSDKRDSIDTESETQSTTVKPSDEPAEKPVFSPTKLGDEFQSDAPTFSPSKPSSTPTKEPSLQIATPATNSIEMPQFLLDVATSSLQSHKIYFTIIEHGKSLELIVPSQIHFYCHAVTLKNGTQFLNQACQNIFVKDVSWVKIDSDSSVNPNDQIVIQLEDLIDEIDFNIVPIISLKYATDVYNIDTSIDLIGLKNNIYNSIIVVKPDSDLPDNNKDTQAPIDLKDPNPVMRNLNFKIHRDMMHNDLQSEIMINFHCHSNCNGSLAGIHVSFCDRSYVRCNNVSAVHQAHSHDNEQGNANVQRRRSLRRLILSNSDLTDEKEFVKVAMVKPEEKLLDKDIDIPVLFEKTWFVPGMSQKADVQVISPKYNWEVSATIEFDVIQQPSFQLHKLFVDEEIDISKQSELIFGFTDLVNVDLEKSKILIECRFNKETDYTIGCRDNMQCNHQQKTCTLTFPSNTFEYRSKNRILFTIFNQDDIKSKNDIVATFVAKDRPPSEKGVSNSIIATTVMIVCALFAIFGVGYGLKTYLATRQRSRYHQMDQEHEPFTDVGRGGVYGDHTTDEDLVPFRA